MPSTETLIRDLADRAELADLVARHSLWIDEARYDQTGRLFTEDIVVTSRRGEARGPEALIAAARSAHDQYPRTMHSKSNLVIELDGDVASVQASDLAIYIVDDKTEAIAAAVHHYGARRTPDGWRFARLDVTPVALTEALGRAL
ncbi:MAG TPA: nuclear transport factor 2 family protein [Streptosporangiaceae bacterium]